MLSDKVDTLRIQNETVATQNILPGQIYQLNTIFNMFLADLVPKLYVVETSCHYLFLYVHRLHV